MDKLEKVLNDIKIADVEPDEEIIRSVKIECNKVVREGKKREAASESRRSRMIVRLLAAASIVAFVFVALVVASIRNQNPIEGAAYYTIDINPSFGFTVDEDNNVIDIFFQNQDAKDLYKGMNVINMKLPDAIRAIVRKAASQGYLSGEDDAYVLLGQFLNDDAVDDEEVLNQLMAGLEGNLGDNVKVIGVNGNKDDLEEAKELEVSPGLLILCEMIGDVDADEDMKVGDLVEKLPDKYTEPEFKAPVIEGTVDGDYLVISWDKIDFSKVEQEGLEVEYKLLKGATLEEIKEMKNVAATQIVNVGDENQPTSFAVEITADELDTKTYYCLYVHVSETSKLSNVLPVTAQLSGNATPEPTERPESAASTISAAIDGDYIKIDWTKPAEDPGFDGYKVMYSATDDTPVYGEEGCYYLEFVTDYNDTTGTYKLSSLEGYEPGKKYYFSITVLYDGQADKVAGNVVTKTMPAAEATPKPTDKPTDKPTETSDYPSTNIRGERDGNIFYLSWGKITDSRLEGYKVVYSFTDSTPVYGENSYVRWITNASTTSTAVNVSELGAHSEGHVYFSITALYNDHSVKKAGNSVKLTTPGYEPDPYVGTSVSAYYNSETGNVTVNWSAVEHPEFEGYKVVYSASDSTPVYGEAGTSYVKWITNASTTSSTFSPEGLNGYGPGETLYFSVTVLYNSHSVKKAGNSVPITFPEDTPTYTAAELTSASYLGDGQFSLSWSTVNSPDFSEYTLLCSLNGSAYAACAEILSMTTSSKTVTIPGVSPGDTCSFKIVTYYNNDYSNGYYGSTVKTVNVPEPDPTPTPEPTATPAPDPTPTPSITSASASGGTVTVQWSCAEHADFEHYMIGYKINGGAEQFDDSIGAAIYWSKLFSGYTDGDTVTVRVIAVYSNGDNNSSGSSTVTLSTAS